MIEFIILLGINQLILLYRVDKCLYDYGYLYVHEYLQNPATRRWFILFYGNTAILFAAILYICWE